jgi:type I restriction enzyme, S subunit
VNFQRLTTTGGRDATEKRVMGNVALSVNHPGLPAPEGWEWFPLTSIARMESGHTPSRKKPEYWGGDISWVGIKDAKRAHGGTVNETLENTNELGINNSSARVLPAGTVCLSRTASVGYVVKMGRDMATSQDFANWVCSDRLDPDFLRYLFIAESSALSRFSSGSVHQTIYYPELKAFHVCVPSLEEQKRIVAVLDQAFAALDRARAHAEANLADAQELLENSLNEVFRDLASTSVVVPLEDAVHPACKLSYGIVQPGDLVEGGLPIVRPVDLKQRVITLNGLKSISPDRADGYARTKLVGGELLLCVRGSTGEVSIASPELAGGNVTRGIVPVRFEVDKVLPEFAYFQFLSRYARDQIAAKTYGAALMQINIADLRRLNFVMPNIAQQKETAARSEHLYKRSQKLKIAYAEKITDLAKLRQSLLQKAFSGQLT